MHYFKAQRGGAQNPLGPQNYHGFEIGRRNGIVSMMMLRFFRHCMLIGILSQIGLFSFSNDIDIFCCFPSNIIIILPPCYMYLSDIYCTSCYYNVCKELN